MPIWLELLVLLLTTYVAGVGIGWMIWGRVPGDDRAKAERENDG